MEDQSNGNEDVTHRENPGATAEEVDCASIWSIDTKTDVRFKPVVSVGQITTREHFISVASEAKEVVILCWT